MIRTVLVEDGSRSRIGGAELIDEWSANSGDWIWVDLDDEPAQPERDLLATRFGISHLAIDDAQRKRHPPKLEVFDSYFFLLLRHFADAETARAPIFTQLAFLVGERFLITRRHLPAPSVDSIWTDLAAGQVKLAKGPAHLCYRIVRRMIDRYTPAVLQVEERIDTLETEMLAHPRDELLAEMMEMNRNLKSLRRMFSYQHALMADLRDSQLALISGDIKHEFHDAYEHMERLASLSGLYQELVVDMMNGYLSLTSHRLNQIMKVLTIVTVIFVPLTLLVGIYGMNFEHMPELHSRYGYFILLGTMALIASGLLYLFRRLRWL